MVQWFRRHKLGLSHFATVAVRFALTYFSHHAGKPRVTVDHFNVYINNSINYRMLIVHT
jgi:hypothetical protein